MKKVLFILPLLAIALVSSCKKEGVESYEPWGFKTQSYFPAPAYNFEGNKQDYNSFVLGRALFYDKILSSDNTVSCSMCHEQPHGFGSHSTSLSVGVGGAIGTRNSPPIFNMAWMPDFMWDGGINHIEVMPIGPITNPLEMNETIANVVNKLQQSERYRKLFKMAYGGSEQVTEQKMLKALAQFMMMIVSDQSKYDQVRRGETTFTATEQQGYDLFVQKCSQCHTEPLFTDYTFRNNGLDATFSDLGRAMITQLASDEGKFKVPTLRNVELTYPYMHDGRFFTLNQVLDHYSSGVQNSATLDPALQSGIPLTASEKLQLIAFLKTLTDYELLNNKWLMEPQD